MQNQAMHKRTWGLTLIELLITVVVLAILLTLVMPNIRDTIARNRISATANDIITAINLARNEAVSRSATVSICPAAAGGAACSPGDWNEGWIVWADANADLGIDPGEELIRSSTESHNAETSISATGNLGNGITFGGDGTVRNLGATNQPMEITKNPHDQGLRISVSASGQTTSEHFDA